MLKNPNSKTRYMPGLDGLRAISVMAVIAYHLNWSVAPGGFLGVGVFFVLSGYLITDQLVARWQRDRSLGLRSFWLRRARRLLPAMLLMTAAVCAYLALTDSHRLGALGGDVASAVTYVNNWWLIFHNVSYFDSFGPPSPFGHYWSLAVEEQFYLLWPLLLAVGLRFVPRRGALAVIILAAAAVSALAMALLYTPGGDPSRVYYGSDTRVFGLLIGAALAVVWPSGRLSAKAGTASRVALNVLGAASLAALLYMIWQMQEYDSFVYRGGLVVLSLVSGVLVATLAHPASGIARVLSAKPLRWLGVRSYGIYLWHYPVIVLTTPTIDTNGVNVTRVALQIAATLLLASLSWKFVEEPILRGAWKKHFMHGHQTQPSRLSSIRRHASVLALASLTVVLCVSCVGTGSVGERSAIASGANDPAAVPGGETAGWNGESPAIGGLPAATGSAPAEPSGSASDNPATGSSAASGFGDSGANSGSSSSGSGGTIGNAGDPPTGGEASSGSDIAVVGANGTSTSASQGKGNAAGVAAAGQGSTSAGTSKPSGSSSGGGAASETTKPKSGKGITVIGDSVILGVKTSLEKLRPGIVVDGKVGRQLSQSFDTVDAHEEAGDLGSIVILELGTNGTFTAKKLSQLLDTLGDKRQILLVNTRVPRKWQDEVNKMLAKAADDRDNVTLVDWYTASKGKDAYFAKDGVHLNSKGALYYAQMLSTAIDKLKA